MTALHYTVSILKPRQKHSNTDAQTHKLMAVVTEEAGWGQNYLHIASLTTDRAVATSPACSNLRDWSNRVSASNTHLSKPSPFPAGDKHYSVALFSTETSTPAFYTHTYTCSPKHQMLKKQQKPKKCIRRQRHSLHPCVACWRRTLVLEFVQIHELAGSGIEAHGCLSLLFLSPL